MKKTVAVFFLIPFIFIMFSAFLGGKQYSAAPVQVESLIRNGRYLEAIDACQQIADSSNQSEVQAKALLMIGDIYGYFLDDGDAALRTYYLLKKTYPKSGEIANAYFNSGMIFYEQGKYRDAVSQFKIYLENYPKGPRRETAEHMIASCDKETAFPAHSEKSIRADVLTVADAAIRVLLMEAATELLIETNSPMEIKDIQGKKTVKETKGSSMIIKRLGEVIAADGESIGCEGFILVPAAKDKIRLDGKAYRGKIMVRKSGSAGINIVNILNLEEYLYGVVSMEMASIWPMETLKAQAVVARTFALYQREKNVGNDYDVSASTASQVYGGFNCETPQAIRAVDDTKGEALRHNGKLILAYYHSNSGGVTEDARYVWTTTDIPYLRGVRDEYSESAPDCRWTFSINWVDLSALLANNGFKFKKIEGIVPMETSPSGRVVKIKILYENGESVLRANDFRLKFDPKQFRSTLFKLREDGDRIVFEGKGYGHGVGLSQWGAREMARQGSSYRDILNHYYSNVVIGKEPVRNDNRP
jgi:stage II sporulation protein D